ncbi:hypothetical protein AURANDRAFT_67350, partial [Aureococcus anophagefferens]
MPVFSGIPLGFQDDFTKLNSKSQAEGKLPPYFGPSYRKLESSESTQSASTAEWGFDRPGFQEPDTEAGVLAPTLRSEIGAVLRPLDLNTGLRGYRAPETMDSDDEDLREPTVTYFRKRTCRSQRSLPHHQRRFKTANAPDALVVRDYLEALKNKALSLKQKTFMDDQLTERVRLATIGKIGMIECEVQMTWMETESFITGLDPSRVEGLGPYAQPARDPTLSGNANGKTALVRSLTGEVPPSTPRPKTKEEPDLPEKREESISPAQSNRMKEPLNDGDSGCIGLPAPVPDPKKLFKEMTKSELINWYSLAQKAIYTASFSNSKKYTHFDESTLQNKLTQFGAHTQCVAPVTLETADQIRTLSNLGKSTTHLIMKSAYERKKMCDEMFTLFQKAYLMDVERAAEKDSIFDQQDKYEELKKVTQPYCVPDLAKCTISEYHQAFMNKIERLEIADASNKKEVCMALMDGYIEPIYLTVKKDARVGERKHLYSNIMSIQLQARKFEDELQLDHQRRLYAKYFLEKTSINVGSASCEWKPGVKNYKVSPRESKAPPVPRAPRPGAGAASNTNQSDSNGPKDPEFWQSESGQEYANKARVKAAELLAKFDLVIDDNEIVRASLVCWNCGSFHMKTGLKQKKDVKVDLRIPCSWMKQHGNLPKNVMTARTPFCLKAGEIERSPKEEPMQTKLCMICAAAIALMMKLRSEFTHADEVLRVKRKFQERLQKEDESYRLLQEMQKDSHANGIRYSSVLKKRMRRNFSPPITRAAKRGRDEPSRRQRKRARSHSNFSGGTRDGWDTPGEPGWSRSQPAQGWGVTLSRDAPLPAKVAPLPAEIVVEDVSQLETAQGLAESQERRPKLEEEEPAETYCQRTQPVTNMKVPGKQTLMGPAPRYDDNPDTRIQVGDMVSYVWPEESKETRGPWTWVVTLVTMNGVEIRPARALERSLQSGGEDLRPKRKDIVFSKYCSHGPLAKDIRLCVDPCRQPTCVWCKQHGVFDYKNRTTFERDSLPEVANTWVSDDIHMAKTLAREDVSTSMKVIEKTMKQQGMLQPPTKRMFTSLTWVPAKFSRNDRDIVAAGLWDSCCNRAFIDEHFFKTLCARRVMPDLKQHKRVTCYSTATLSLRPGEERVIKVKFSAKIPEGQWVDDQYDCAIKGEWADNPHTDDPENHRNGMVLVGRSRTDIGGFMWEGDGTRHGQTYVKNTHQNLPIRIERGQELGETNVISGVVTGSADSRTGEVFHLDDDATKQVAERASSVEHKFSKLKWLPLTFIQVIVFYSGIGGFDKGLQRAWEKHGAAFKVVLAIDNCELSNEIHRNTFPGVTVVNHILGKSFKATMDLISEYIPREQWSSMYWHASPSCIEGSTANMQKRNVKEFVKLTLWTLSLMKQCRPGMWTLEQIPVIARYVMLETPYAEVLNMREFTAQTSDRKRLIASKAHTMQTEYAQEPLNMSVIDLPDICKDELGVAFNMGSTQPPERLDVAEARPNKTRRLYAKYFLEKTSINVGSASCEWKPGVKNYKVSPRESKAPPVPRAPRPGAGAASNTNQSDSNGPKDPEFWQSESGQEYANKARVKAAELLAKFDLVIDDNEIVRASLVCWNCGSFHMKTGLKQKKDVKVDLRIPCSWMKQHGNLPKNVMTARTPFCLKAGEIERSPKEEPMVLAVHLKSHQRMIQMQAKFSQNTAVQLMDSVTDGTLWSADQHPQKDTEAEGAAANSTETTAEAEVWPPWKNADRDERGLPLPDQPKDLGVDDQWRVKPATDQELIDTMKRIGVTDNPVLGDSMKQHFKEMIAYCWGMFDKTLRPVDSDPVGIQFLDPRQQPIKLQPYRLNAPKLAFLKDTIQEWIRDGIIRP